MAQGTIHPGIDVTLESIFDLIRELEDFIAKLRIGYANATALDKAIKAAQINYLLWVKEQLLQTNKKLKPTDLTSVYNLSKCICNVTTLDDLQKEIEICHKSITKKLHPSKEEKIKQEAMLEADLLACDIANMISADKLSSLSARFFEITGAKKKLKQNQTLPAVVDYADLEGRINNAYGASKDKTIKVRLINLQRVLTDVQGDALDKKFERCKEAYKQEFLLRMGSYKRSGASISKKKEQQLRDAISELDAKENSTELKTVIHRINQQFEEVFGEKFSAQNKHDKDSVEARLLCDHLAGRVVPAISVDWTNRAARLNHYRNALLTANIGMTIAPSSDEPQTDKQNYQAIINELKNKLAESIKATDEATKAKSKSKKSHREAMSNQDLSMQAKLAHALSAIQEIEAEHLALDEERLLSQLGTPTEKTRIISSKKKEIMNNKVSGLQARIELVRDGIKENNTLADKLNKELLPLRRQEQSYLESGQVSTALVPVFNFQTIHQKIEESLQAKEKKLLKCDGVISNSCNQAYDKLLKIREKGKLEEEQNKARNDLYEKIKNLYDELKEAKKSVASKRTLAIINIRLQYILSKPSMSLAELRSCISDIIALARPSGKVGRYFQVDENSRKEEYIDGRPAGVWLHRVVNRSKVKEHEFRGKMIRELEQALGKSETEQLKQKTQDIQVNIKTLQELHRGCFTVADISIEGTANLDRYETETADCEEQIQSNKNMLEAYKKNMPEREKLVRYLEDLKQQNQKKQAQEVAKKKAIEDQVVGIRQIIQDTINQCQKDPAAAEMKSKIFEEIRDCLMDIAKDVERKMSEAFDPSSERGEKVVLKKLRELSVQALRKIFLMQLGFKEAEMERISSVEDLEKALILQYHLPAISSGSHEIEEIKTLFEQFNYLSNSDIDTIEVLLNAFVCLSAAIKHHINKEYIDNLKNSAMFQATAQMKSDYHHEMQERFRRGRLQIVGYRDVEVNFALEERADIATYVDEVLWEYSDKINPVEAAELKDLKEIILLYAFTEGRHEYQEIKGYLDCVYGQYYEEGFGPKSKNISDILMRMSRIKLKDSKARQKWSDFIAATESNLADLRKSEQIAKYKQSIRTPANGIRSETILALEKFMQTLVDGSEAKKVVEELIQSIRKPGINLTSVENDYICLLSQLLLAIKKYTSAAMPVLGDSTDMSLWACLQARYKSVMQVYSAQFPASARSYELMQRLVEKFDCSQDEIDMSGFSEGLSLEMHEKSVRATVVHVIKKSLAPNSNKTNANAVVNREVGQWIIEQLNSTDQPANLIVAQAAKLMVSYQGKEYRGMQDKVYRHVLESILNIIGKPDGVVPAPASISILSSEMPISSPQQEIQVHRVLQISSVALKSLETEYKQWQLAVEEYIEPLIGYLKKSHPQDEKIRLELIRYLAVYALSRRGKRDLKAQKNAAVVVEAIWGLLQGNDIQKIIARARSYTDLGKNIKSLLNAFAEIFGEPANSVPQKIKDIDIAYYYDLPTIEQVGSLVAAPQTPHQRIVPPAPLSRFNSIASSMVADWAATPGTPQTPQSSAATPGSASSASSASSSYTDLGSPVVEQQRLKARNLEAVMGQVCPVAKLLTLPVDQYGKGGFISVDQQKDQLSDDERAQLTEKYLAYIKEKLCGLSDLFMGHALQNGDSLRNRSKEEMDSKLETFRNALRSLVALTPDSDRIDLARELAHHAQALMIFYAKYCLGIFSGEGLKFWYDGFHHVVSEFAQHFDQGQFVTIFGKTNYEMQQFNIAEQECDTRIIAGMFFGRPRSTDLGRGQGHLSGKHEGICAEIYLGSNLEKRIKACLFDLHALLDNICKGKTSLPSVYIPSTIYRAILLDDILAHPAVMVAIRQDPFLKQALKEAVSEYNHLVEFGLKNGEPQSHIAYMAAQKNNLGSDGQLNERTTREANLTLKHHYSFGGVAAHDFFDKVSMLAREERDRSSAIDFDDIPTFDDDLDQRRRPSQRGSV